MLIVLGDVTAHAVASAHTLGRVAEAAVGNPSWDSLVQYGVLGLVVLGFITGHIVPGHHAKQLLEENKRLSSLIEGKLLPMSETYAATLEKSANVMEKATEALERKIDAHQQLVAPHSHGEQG